MTSNDRALKTRDGLIGTLRDVLGGADLSLSHKLESLYGDHVWATIHNALDAHAAEAREAAHARAYKAYDSADKAHDQQRARADGLLAQLTEARKERGILKVRLDAAEDTTRAANLDAARERERADGLEAELHASQAVAAALVRRADGLSAWRREFEPKLQEARARAASRAARVAELEQQLHSISQDRAVTIEQYEARVRELEAELGSIDRSCPAPTDLQARVRELEAKLDEERRISVGHNLRAARLEHGRDEARSHLELHVSHMSEERAEAHAAGWRAGRDDSAEAAAEFPEVPYVEQAIRALEPPTGGEHG